MQMHNNAMPKKLTMHQKAKSAAKCTENARKCIKNGKKKEKIINCLYR